MSQNVSGLRLEDLEIKPHLITRLKGRRNRINLWPSHIYPTSAHWRWLHINWSRHQHCTRYCNEAKRH